MRYRAKAKGNTASDIHSANHNAQPTRKPQKGPHACLAYAYGPPTFGISDAHCEKQRAITMAINPAKTQTTREKGPREPAPKLEATYMSAPIMAPTTRLVTSKSVSFFCILLSVINANPN